MEVTNVCFNFWPNICKHICLHRMINHDNQIFFQEITLTCEAENEEGATASSVSLPVHCEYNYPCVCLFGICLFVKGTISCIGFLQQELCCIRVWMFLDGPELLGDLVEQRYAMPPKALSDKMQPLNLKRDTCRGQKLLFVWEARRWAGARTQVRL